MNTNERLVTAVDDVLALEDPDAVMGAVKFMTKRDGNAYIKAHNARVTAAITGLRDARAVLDAPAEDDAAALVGFLESLDGLFVALRDAESSDKGVSITLKDLAISLHMQTRIFLNARKAPVQG